MGCEAEDDDVDGWCQKRVQGKLDGVRLRSAAAGHDYTLVVSEDGELFSFGSGLTGCLGHGDDETQMIPELVQSLSPAHGHVVREVASTKKGAMALTADSKVFVWGYNGKFLPQQVDGLDGIRVTFIQPVIGTWPQSLTPEPSSPGAWIAMAA
jgi:alpha-tubulin suppressor-like RCC1 family protein